MLGIADRVVRPPGHGRPLDVERDQPLWQLSTRDRRSLAAFCRTLADEEAAGSPLRDAFLQLIRGCDLDHDYGT
jgi:hypothetical protein